MRTGFGWCAFSPHCFSFIAYLQDRRGTFAITAHGP